MGLLSKSSSSATSITEVQTTTTDAKVGAVEAGAVLATTGSTVNIAAPTEQLSRVIDLAESVVSRVLETTDRVTSEAGSLAGASVSALGEQRTRETEPGAMSLEKLAPWIAVAFVAVAWLAGRRP